MAKTGVKEVLGLDDALAATGYGRFHYSVVATCSFCLLSAGFQNSLSAYILPAAQRDLSLSTSQIGFCNAAFLIGGTSSTFLWGLLADSFGRKKVLANTLLADFLVTVGFVLVQDVASLIACRFFNGFLIAAAGSLTFNYVAEFHAPRHRSQSICLAGVSFTLSWLLLPILAWCILPKTFTLGRTALPSWRIFIAILSLPELVACSSLYYLPESPKFLALECPDEALKVLKQMFKTNTGKSAEEFPVKSLIPETKLSYNAPYEGNVKVFRAVKTLYNQFLELFTAPLFVITVITSGAMFSNMFGYYGLGLWLPQIFSKIANKVTPVIKATPPYSSKFDLAIFQTTSAIGISCIIGNVLSGCIAGRFHQKLVPLLTMTVGGVCAGSMYWLRTYNQNLIAASIFLSAMSSANLALGSIVVNLFPTSIGGMALCVAMCAGRVGAIISNVLIGSTIDTRYDIVLFMVSGILLVGGCLCLKIPESGKTMKKPKDKQDIEVSVISGNNTNTNI